MKISKSTLTKIKAYILDTQAKSTYNSSPHEPLEMCWNERMAEVWNLGNCYKYLNRYLSSDGEKKGDIKDLLKVCHYSWFESCRHGITSNNQIVSDYIFKKMINESDYLDEIIRLWINESPDLNHLPDSFKENNKQVNGRFWDYSEYFQLATLLIQELETEHIDLETT